MGTIGKTHLLKIQNTSGLLKTLRHRPENTYYKTYHQSAKDKVRERGVGHGQRGYARNNISDDISATLVDHVINHGLTMREAGQRVHPHLSRFTVASIIRTFGLENRYVFNTPLQTISTVFTVLYHITLLYHIASWLVLLL